MPARPTRPRGSAGFATVELAATVPALLVLVGLCGWLLTAVQGQLQVVDAARAGAREAARGEVHADVRRSAERRAPDGASVTIRRHGAEVSVSVAAQVRPFGGVLRRLPALTVRSTAHARVEPGLP